ncbi:MAG: hypothetical protein ABFS02_12955 [Pseudomonadota bacterium]
MKTANTRFFWGAGAAFGLAALYPASIWINLGSDGSRWIQNDLAYSFFVLFILPLAVGVFARSFQFDVLQRLPRTLRYAAVALLLVIEFFAGFLAAQEIFRHDSVPAFLLRESSEPLRLDQCLRACVRQYQDKTMRCDVEDCPGVVEQLMLPGEESPGRRAADIFGQATGVGAFEGYRDVSARANWTVYVSIFFDVASGMFVMLVFWYLVLVVLTRRGREANLSDSLTMVYGLLLLWFPARLYSEWYLNFYTLTSVREYFAFWTLFAVAIMAIPLLVYLFKPGRPVLIFSSVNGVFIAAIGILNHFKPGVLGLVARGFESMPFAYFLAMVLLVFIVLATMVFTLGIQHELGEQESRGASGVG